MKYKLLFIFLLYSPLPNNSYFLILGQQIHKYEQIDTVKVNNSPKSMTLIFKIYDYPLVLKDEEEYRVTHMDIYNYYNKKVFQIINDTSAPGFGGDYVKYVDMNFDGYLDLDIPLGYFNLTPLHSFWIYDVKNNQYYHSSELSEIHDYKLDSIKKVIESDEQDVGGKGAYVAIYRIAKGKLKLIESEDYHYSDYEHKKLINDTLITVDLDEMSQLKDSVFVDSSWSWVWGKLRLINVTKKISLFDQPLPDELKYSEIAYEDVTGSFIFKSKELFEYKKNKLGEIICFRTLNVVKDKKWVKGKPTLILIK